MTIDDAAIKKLCELDFMTFIRLTFKEMHAVKFTVNQHHKEIISALKKTETGEITRLIINTPPRYSKTEILKNYIARGILMNPHAKFLYLSYSGELAMDCSEGIKNVINLPICKKLWGVNIKHGSNAKHKWYTEQGGGLYATSTRGQVTGFGAGVFNTDNEMGEFINNFGGAIIIDDPIKPEDAIESPRMRELINNRFNNTIRSRVNSKTTPFIIIMQRLHTNDLTGFLENGGDGEVWHKVVQKAVKEDGTPLWEYKHSLKDLENLRLSNNMVFESQYMQNPKPLEGIAFPAESLRYFKRSDLIGKQPDYIVSFADIADGGGDYYSMPIAYCYFNSNNNIDVYIIDCIYTKQNGVYYEPATIRKFEEHKIIDHVIEMNNQGSVHFRKIQTDKGHIGTKLYPAQAKGNKLIRIELQTRFIIENCYFLNRSEYSVGSDYYYFMFDLTEYRKDGKNANDDSPDSLSGLCKYIRTRFASKGIR